MGVCVWGGGGERERNYSYSMSDTHNNNMIIDYRGGRLKG